MDFVFRIEDVLRIPVPQIAPSKCARELAEQLWHAKRMPFAERLPTVADAEQDECPEDPAVHRAVLEEYAGLDPEVQTSFFEKPRDAREILRRLDLLGHPALSQEDETALDGSRILPKPDSGLQNVNEAGRHDLDRPRSKRQRTT